jgi:hypothetical protein
MSYFRRSTTAVQGAFKAIHRTPQTRPYRYGLHVFLDKPTRIEPRNAIDGSQALGFSSDSWGNAYTMTIPKHKEPSFNGCITAV